MEEEWTTDTVSRDFINARHSEHQACEFENAIRSTAKVTIVTSSKTKKEILHAEVQNTTDTSSNEPFDIFMEALAKHGGQFDALSSPVVAGLILDAQYNRCSEYPFGHVGAGRQNGAGISLGTFGSHLTYSWPRFMEEINSCLTDPRLPGARITEGKSPIWKSCALGQSAFLSAVGLAFGVDRYGHMQDTAAQDWRRFCMPDAERPDCSIWDLRDALNLRLSSHFLLPSDKSLTDKERTSEPAAEPHFTENEEGELDAILHIRSPIGLVRISFNGVPEATPSSSSPAGELEYLLDELEQRFDRAEPLRIDVLSFNGKELTIEDVWKTLSVKKFIRIPGSAIRLSKRSVYTDAGRFSKDSVCEWAQLLKERGPDGTLHRAISIDMRVGGYWEGGIVEYADGHKSHWGAMRTDGREHNFASVSHILTLPPMAAVKVKRIEINRGRDEYMQGVRVHLTHHIVRGELNVNSDYEADNIRLEPERGEDVVGFYGRSGLRGGVMEFGIITCASDVGMDGLPEAVFDMPELRNTIGMDDERTGDE